MARKKDHLEKIDVAFCDPGMVQGWFAWSITNAYGELAQLGMQGIVHRTSGPILNQNRNTLVQMFLEGPNDWLYMVDTDMVLDDNHIIRLWETAKEHDVKMVGGLAFIFHQAKTPVPNFFIHDKSDPPDLVQVYNHIPDKPFEAVSTGLATVLVHRDVFESMLAPRHHERRWFDDIPSRYNDKIAGEDVSFFLRARDAGFRLLINPHARTGHIKNFPIGYPDWHRVWKEDNHIDIMTPNEPRKLNVDNEQF
jgi:glycosyltransferase involved in cell wall biosynthesis